MYGDFSRMTYSPAKGYTGVWAQQGRVQLDADANEQTAILQSWLRTLATDLIGPFGGHVSRAGFAVALQDGDLTFSPGHYYVYGWRCEITAPATAAAPGATYHGLVPGAPALPAPPYLVQLLVWQRSVSAVSDPDLLEPALGPRPPDTTVRTQTAWVPAVSQALPAPDGTALGEVPASDLTTEFISGKFEESNAARASVPLLAARVDHDVETDEASIVPATSGFLGVENQLYRVEIHAGGTAGVAGPTGPAQPAGAAPPTFKWSRDNGCAQFAVVAIADDETKAADPVVKVTVASLGRDERTGLSVGDWVEVIDDTWAPQGAPGPLRAVRGIDRAELTVTLDGAGPVSDLSQHPYLRRWDQPADDPADQGGIPVVESSADDSGDWLNLEDGVQIRFVASGAEYQRGDYWLIPARTATGALLWPGGATPNAVPPHGPTRYLVPLALVTDSEPVEDLRTLFTHLAWPEPGPSGTSSSGTGSSDAGSKA
jgi:hypothetical protein